MGVKRQLRHCFLNSGDLDDIVACRIDTHLPCSIFCAYNPPIGSSNRWTESKWDIFFKAIAADSKRNLILVGDRNLNINRRSLCPQDSYEKLIVYSLNLVNLTLTVDSLITNANTFDLMLFNYDFVLKIENDSQLDRAYTSSAIRQCQITELLGICTRESAGQI